MIRVIFLILISAVAANAQFTESAIKGVIKDSAGNSVAGAEVVAIDPATGQQRGSQTNTDGIFYLPGLLSGGYTLRVKADGFRAFEQALRLYVGQTTEVSVSLEVGSTTDLVEVRAGGAQYVSPVL